MLVLDEADKMLDLGFKDEIEKILALLPSHRQNILFSATLDTKIDSLKANWLNEAVKIEVEPEEDHTDLITQIAYSVDASRKGPLLRYLIKTREMKQVLVFMSSIRAADNLVIKLKKNGVQAIAIHSNKGQNSRMEALRTFKAGKVNVLVATDLASRGIDIQFLPFVINYELPRSPKDYVHRIGRTGRAEASGEAITFVTPEDAHHFQVIQKKMKKQIELIKTDELELKGF
jgi:ATP-dependent RNA helicase RhlE